MSASSMEVVVGYMYMCTMNFIFFMASRNVVASPTMASLLPERSIHISGW